jgi:DNA-directed RNA polymerase specialized sigma subunit
MENDELNFRDLFSTETLESIEGVETLIEVEQFLKFLPVREKQILYLTACGHTQAEIGEIVGLTGQRVGQILAVFSKSHSKLHS